MKKILSFLFILVMTFTMTGCKKNDPFNYLAKNNSACVEKQVIATNDFGDRREIANYNMYIQVYDSCSIRYISFTSGNESYKEYTYAEYSNEEYYYKYVYDFKLQKWNKEVINHEKDQVDLLDKSIYEYDKETKKYKVMPTIDLGNFLSSTIYVEDDKVIHEYSYSLFISVKQVLYEVTDIYSDWSKDFKLKENLPKL